MIATFTTSNNCPKKKALTQRIIIQWIPNQRKRFLPYTIVPCNFYTCLMNNYLILNCYFDRRNFLEYSIVPFTKFCSLQKKGKFEHINISENENNKCPRCQGTTEVVYNFISLKFQVRFPYEWVLLRKPPEGVPHPQENPQVQEPPLT